MHTYNTLDVKAIREASGKDRKTFAAIIGASYDTVVDFKDKSEIPTAILKCIIKLQEA